jgi:hypothetical protein
VQQKPRLRPSSSNSNSGSRMRDSSLQELLQQQRQVRVLQPMPALLLTLAVRNRWPPRRLL